MRFFYAHQSKPLIINTCDSGAIRTLDPRLRRALLYPAELRNQTMPEKRCKNTLFEKTTQTFSANPAETCRLIRQTGISANYSENTKSNFI